ncbi:MAG: polysaccharide biosynthesis C-terminal domain-containing protein [Planctomycetota bacterium]|nr:polysaccharide biosynthesis C-terminal domain-containing protein [Planctomycetota bacterium]
MPEISKNVKNGVLAIGDQMVVSAGTFLTVMIVSRNCTAFEVGVFSLTWTVIAVLRTVQERLIAAPFLAFTYQPRFNRTTYRGSSIAHQLCFAGFSSGVVAIVALCLPIFSGRIHESALGLSLAVALFFNLARDQMRALSYTDFSFFRLLLLDSLVVGSQLVGLLLLSWSQRFSLINTNIILGIACIAPLVIWLRQIRSTFEINREWVNFDWFHNWNYARWLVGGRLIGIAPIVAVPWLIAYFRGEEGTGIYAVCSSLVGLSMMFVTGVNNMFQPRTVLEFQKNGLGGMLASLFSSITLMIVVLSIVSLAFWFVGDRLLSTYGQNYAQYSFIAFLLSISILIVSVSCSLGNGLVALNQSRALFWSEVSHCVGAVAFAFILIPSYGLHGAAYASIVGSAAATIVSMITLTLGVLAYKQSSALQHLPVLPAIDEIRRI